MLFFIILLILKAFSVQNLGESFINSYDSTPKENFKEYLMRFDSSSVKMSKTDAINSSLKLNNRWVEFGQFTTQLFFSLHTQNIVNEWNADWWTTNNSLTFPSEKIWIYLVITYNSETIGVNITEGGRIFLEPQPAPPLIGMDAVLCIDFSGSMNQARMDITKTAIPFFLHTSEYGD
jgi:hypothetical protein